MNDCKEILLDDIVRADFYMPDTVMMDVPFGVSGVIEMSMTQKVNGEDVDLSADVGEPLLSVGYSGSDLDVLMERPSYKSSSKREAIGEIYNHTFQIPVLTGFEAIKRAIYTLNGGAVVMVLTSYDGTKSTVNSFCNTPRLNYDETRGNSHTGTLSYAAESFSGIVALTKHIAT